MINSFIKKDNILIFIGLVVFGISMIALYSASSAYHWYKGSTKTIIKLRKIDHAMIFVLIAGSYTPLAISCFEKPYGFHFLIIIWLVAILGVVLKLMWIDIPRFISTIIYILLGGAILTNLSNFSYIPLLSIVFIFFTSLSYFIGAIIYVIKKPNLSKAFGFHEVFHIFILFGSLFYFIAIFLI